MSSVLEMDYPLLSINAGIIGAIFLFFSIASMASDFSIFNFDPNGCSYGFYLEPAESQIAITVAVGVILVPFALSSLMILLRNESAKFITSTGFALIISSAVMIIASLSCRIPYEFLTNIMIVPAIFAVGVTVLLFWVKKSNIKSPKNHLKNKEDKDDFTIAS